MKKVILLAALILAPCVLAQSLDIRVVDYRHPNRYIDKEDCYKGSQNGTETYLTETIIKIRVTAGSPIPDADVRISYELDGKRETEYFKTDVWGEVEIALPFVERKPIEVQIDAVAHPQSDDGELGGALSGSTKVIVVPYGRSPGEFLSWWTG